MRTPPDVAVCLAGELRTFAMPLVHTTIKRAADHWGADIFMVYHTSYNAARMGQAHRAGAIGCLSNESALRLLNPVAVQLFRADYFGKRICDLSSSRQFAQIDQSFELARSHAKARGRAYRLFVRLRPDLLILNEQPPDLPRWSRWDRLRCAVHELRGHHPAAHSCAGIHTLKRPTDFAFALDSKAAGAWSEWGRANLLPCPREHVKYRCCMDFAHPMMEGGHRWRVAGSNPNVTCFGPNASKYLDWGAPKVWSGLQAGVVRSEYFIDSLDGLRPLMPAESQRLTCEVAHRPALPRAAAIALAPSEPIELKEMSREVSTRSARLKQPSSSARDSKCFPADWDGVGAAEARRVEFIDRDFQLSLLYKKYADFAGLSKKSPPLWSDRYSTAVHCGGHGYLFSRRAGTPFAQATSTGGDLHAWHTVVRRRIGAYTYGEALPIDLTLRRWPWQGPQDSMTLVGVAEQMAHNAGFLCDASGMRVLAYGGRDWDGRLDRSGRAQEGIRRLEAPAGWPLVWTALSRRPARQQTWSESAEALLLLAEQHPAVAHGALRLRQRDPSLVLDGVHARCEERRIATFGHRLGGRCEFDGRVVPVRFRGRYWLYVRANLHTASGARHVQAASSADGVGGWSAFALLTFDGVDAGHPENNIYSFTAQPYEEGLLGLFPGVLHGQGGGVFWTMSRDGLHWTHPQLLMRSAHKQRRTADHPVGFEIVPSDGLCGGARSRRRKREEMLRLHVEHQISTLRGNLSRPYHCVYAFCLRALRPVLRRVLRQAIRPNTTTTPRAMTTTKKSKGSKARPEPGRGGGARPERADGRGRRRRERRERRAGLHAQ